MTRRPPLASILSLSRLSVRLQQLLRMDRLSPALAFAPLRRYWPGLFGSGFGFGFLVMAWMSKSSMTTRMFSRASLVVVFSIQSFLRRTICSCRTLN